MPRRLQCQEGALFDRCCGKHELPVESQEFELVSEPSAHQLLDFEVCTREPSEVPLDL